MRKLVNALLLTVALVGSTPVRVQQSPVTQAAMLPAAMWWIYAGIAYTTALFWYAVSEMSCGDCAFRGRGAGGDF